MQSGHFEKVGTFWLVLTSHLLKGLLEGEELVLMLYLCYD